MINFKGDRMCVENQGRITSIKAHPEHSNLFVVANSFNNVLLYDSRIDGAYKRFGGPQVMSNSIDILNDVIVTGSYRSHDEIELFSMSKQVKLDSFNFNKTNQSH